MAGQPTIHLELLPDAVVIVDTHGRIERVNSLMEKLLGYDRGELIGQPIEMLIPERVRDNHVAHRTGFSRAPRVRPMGEGLGLSARHKNGKEVPVEIMLSPAAEGTVMAVVRDITRRRELERFRDEYIGYISHDLKNPLSIISLQARLLARRLGDHDLPEEERLVEIIAQSAAFIDRMVREMLEMSYLESENVELSRETTELASFLKDVLERTVSTNDRWRVRLEVRDAATAQLDGTRVERVIVNFVQNALKYAGEESVVLVRLEARGEMAVISVIDEGPGLSPEEASFVFDKYRRTKTVGKREGLGLGLYISRKIVEAHGGRIGVDSKLGQGSTFFFQIPLAAREKNGTAFTVELASQVKDNAVRLAGAHVLLVDDEVHALSALSALLAEDGIEVSTASNGDDALAKAAAKPPHAVVLDVEMPGMNGPTLLLKLRERIPELPAVFMTGYMEHHAGIAEAREATGAAYVSKPVDVDELMRVLARLLPRT